MCPRALPAFYFGAPVLSWAVLQIQGLVWGGAPRRGSRLSLLLPLGRPRQQCMEKLIKTHAGRDPVDQAMRCHRKQAAWCWQSTLWLYNADLFSTQPKIVRSQSSAPQCSTFILANISELLSHFVFVFSPTSMSAACMSCRKKTSLRREPLHVRVLQFCMCTRTHNFPCLTFF